MMKNKSLILISSFFILLSISLGYWFIVRPETSKRENINEAAAIELVKNKYSDLKEYPSDQLPPRSIKTEKAADGWYIAFIQEESDRPIIRAACFFVNNNKNVARIGEFNPNIDDAALNISPKTCRTAALSDDQTEKPASSGFGNGQAVKTITDYFLTQKYFSWKTTADSRNFCVIENLNPTENGLFPLYVWVRCGEFVLQNGELKELSGTSGPARIDYPNELSYYSIGKMSYEAPRDGSLYSEDIKTIFPLDVQKAMFDFDITSLNIKIESIALDNFKDFRQELPVLSVLGHTGMNCRPMPFLPILLYNECI